MQRATNAFALPLSVISGFIATIDYTAENGGSTFGRMTVLFPFRLLFKAIWFYS